MGPPTALCMTLAAVALLVLASTRLRPWRPILVGALGAIICALGSMVVSGYLLGLPETVGWGSLTRMALHTAIAFIAIGGTLCGWVFLRQITAPVNIRELRRSIIVYTVVGSAVIAFVASALAVVPVYVRMQNGERERLIDLGHASAALITQHLGQITEQARLLSSRIPLTHADGGGPAPAAAGDLVQDALRTSHELSGIARFDAQGQLIVQVGSTAAAHRWTPVLRDAPRARAAGDLVLLRGGYQEVVAVPLLDALRAAASAPTW
jgi:hypothetical protein